MGRNTEVLISESRGLYSEKLSYVRKTSGPGSGNNLLQKIGDYDKLTKTVTGWRLNNILLTIRQIFLPYGYPDSVSTDYMQYQIYDTLQAFCSSLTGALATEAVMKGVGVGDETATPLAAAVTWLLKSGSGMVGQIVFTWCQGTNLDSDCKKWRFFADVVNDTATFIDLLSPALSSSIRLPIFCVSSVARSLVGVAGGATRAAITQHQARCNNTADVSAKDGSQETLVNLVALIASLLILPAVSGKLLLVWALYIVCTAGHLIANYKALKSLQLESLNNARLLYCLKEFLSKGTVLPLKTVNDLESVVLGTGVKETDVAAGGYRIRLGISLQDALPLVTSSSSNGSYAMEPLERALSYAEKNGKSFLIIPDCDTKTVTVILHENVPQWEIIEAYCRSVFLTHALQECQSVDAADGASITRWSKFEAALINHGYATDRALLKMGDWRACWRKHL